MLNNKDAGRILNILKKYWVKDPGLFLILVSSTLFFLIFFAISLFRYNTLQYHDWDLSLLSNGMWNIIHGRARIPIMERAFLGNHFNVIAFILAPVYFIFRSPVTLLLFKNLFLSLAAVPIYLVARRKFEWREAVMFPLLYFAYPSLLYVALYEFHFEDFSILFLALTFYFLIVNKKLWLFFSALLAMLCKENVPMVVAAIGLYALIFRPKRRLVGLLLFLVATAYFFLITLKLQPALSPGGVGYAEQYKEYGTGFAEIFSTMLCNPVILIKNLFSTELKRRFFSDIFSPLLYLPILAPHVLFIAFPTFLKNLLSAVPTTHTIYWHYSATIIPFVIFAYIYGLKNLRKIHFFRKAVKYIPAFTLVLELAMSFNLYKGSHYFVRFHSKITPEDSAKMQAVSMVPKKASVITTFDFLPKMGQRNNIYTFYVFWRGWQNFPPQVEYALIDFNDYFIEKDYNFAATNVSRVLSEYTMGKDWGLLYAKGDVALLKRGFGSTERLLTPLNALNPALSNTSFIRLDDSMELSDFTATRSENDNTIHLVFYWKTLRPTPAVYGVYFFVSDGMREVAFCRHSVCYRFYTPLLPQNVILKEDYWLLLPDGLAQGQYILSMAFVNLTTRKPASIKVMSDKAKLDNRGKIVIGAFNY